MQKTVLIIGNSQIAAGVAAALAAQDFTVLAAGNLPRQFSHGEGLPQPSGRIEYLPDAEIISCSGSAGNFTVRMSSQGRCVNRHAAAVVIAPDHLLQPNFHLYQLKPSPFVAAASHMFARLNGSRANDLPEITGGRIVLLNGLVDQSVPAVFQEIMQLSLLLQTRFRCRTYVFSSQLKVAGSGLEALYHQVKRAGAVFIKTTRSLPHIQQDSAGRVRIEYLDEVLGERLEISPSLTVVDEARLPSGRLASFGSVFKLESDNRGYLQGDNVHRSGVSTNRKGILVAGPARGLLPADRTHVEIENCIAAVKAVRTGGAPAVKLDQGKCIHCLTCYRICPYRAVVAAPRVTIAPDACEGCGICVAECPRGAIRFEPAAPADSIALQSPGPHISADNGFSPHLTVFCCRRSALAAYRTALQLGCSLPRNLKLVELPCAGALSTGNIYQAFSRGTDGVLVLTCHPDNCHARNGNFLVNVKADLIAKRFLSLGFAADRLSIRGIAANMAERLVETIDEFEKNILTLGPSPFGNDFQEK